MDSYTTPNGKDINYPKMIGQAVFLSSIQAAFGSIEMSSKFSVINFAKDQETLQNAADALRQYWYVAIAWTIATILVMYGQYGFWGGVTGLAANLVYLAWIHFSYLDAFAKAAKKYGLKEPTVF